MPSDYESEVACLKIGDKAVFKVESTSRVGSKIKEICFPLNSTRDVKKLVSFRMIYSLSFVDIVHARLLLPSCTHYCEILNCDILQ